MPDICAAKIVVFLKCCRFNKTKASLFIAAKINLIVSYTLKCFVVLSMKKAVVFKLLCGRKLLTVRVFVMLTYLLRKANFQ